MRTYLDVDTHTDVNVETHIGRDTAAGTDTDKSKRPLSLSLSVYV